MILIVGAECSGKKAFAKTLGYDETDIAVAKIDSSPVICDIQEMIFENPDIAESLYPELLTKKIVICNEVGSGVIPITRNERHAREATGRLCCKLAKEASEVYRMVCGIPVKIK